MWGVLEVVKKVFSAPFEKKGREVVDWVGDCFWGIADFIMEVFPSIYHFLAYYTWIFSLIPKVLEIFLQ